jgi:acid phosphatase
MKHFDGFLFIFSFLLFFSCAPEIQNLHFVKQEIAAYYESGRFDKEVDAIIDEAKKKFETVEAGDSAAVIFDVDETALNNYEAIKEISFGYAPKLWDKWVEEARAPAIPGVKRLYDFLIGKGIRIIFITGRKEHHYDATIQNLNITGYTQFDTLIVKMKDDHGLKAVDFKSKKRGDLASKGYRIIGNVGDQWSDLEGPNSGIKIKIPDYLYYVE